jgi:RNA polymerase sigma factor (sigma-70 family)
VQAEELLSAEAGGVAGAAEIEPGSWRDVFDHERMLADARPRLLQLARLRGVPVDAIEDVVQETLLVAWRKLDQLYSPEGIQPWLYEICRRVSARYLQHFSKVSARQTSLSDQPMSSDELLELDDALVEPSRTMAARDPAEVLEYQDLSNLLRQALYLLPDQAREAIESYYLLDYSHREAAIRLGLSVSALETRLHRARNRLRQILSTDLRRQAASLAVPLSEEPAMDWPATAVWCYFCGHHRLHGVLETLPDGQRYLRMRCPECSDRFGVDIVNSKGMVSLGDLHSLQPAFKRTMRELSRRLSQAVLAGTVDCPRCGRLVPFEVGGPKPDTSWTPDHRVRRTFWIRGLCPGCGQGVGGFSADDAVYWSHPTIAGFIQRYPRWLNELDTALEYQGQPAILFRLSDQESRAQLHVLCHRHTLAVLAVFEQH